MKKIIPLLLLLLIIILPTNVNALSIDKNNLTMDKNSSESISLYTTVEENITEISFTLVYSTYDIPGYFYVASGLTDSNPNGIAHKIVFSEPTSGNISLGTIKINVVANPKDNAGTINITSATAITESGETINLTSQTINVTIKKNAENKPVEEETKKEQDINKEKENKNNNDTTQNTEKTEEKEKEETKTNNMLEKIESNIVKIQLKENVYEYTIKVKNDIEELDLTPVAKDKKYKVEISNQKISELKDNTITIKVKDGDNLEEYKIKVNVVEDIEEIEIDESIFESTYKYKGKWITLIIILTVVLFAGLILTKKK